MLININYLTQDWYANTGNTKGKVFSFVFRLVSLSAKNKFLFYLLLPARLAYKIFFELIIGIEIPYNTKIGKGMRIFHLQSIIINKNVIIGDNCTLRHLTTIGNKSENGLSPKIGNNVNIGANVCIIGDIVVGTNVKIGAGSVVVKSIPSNSIAVGNPAIIKQNQNIT